MRTITVTYPNGDSVELRPVAISELGIVSDRLERILEAWYNCDYSTGDALCIPDVWEAIKLIASMLPRVQDPSIRGFDIELLSSDYEQLESLFFGGGNFWDPLKGKYAPEKLEAGRVLWLHQFEPIKKLRAVIARQQLDPENTSIADSPQQTSPSPAVETRSQTDSPTSLSDVQKSPPGHGKSSTGKPVMNSSTP